MSRREKEDVVAVTIARLRSLAPNAIDDDMARQVERQIRREFSGENYVYSVARMEAAERREHAVHAFCIERKPAAAAAGDARISRRTLYRELSKSK